MFKTQSNSIYHIGVAQGNTDNMEKSYLTEGLCDVRHYNANKHHDSQRCTHLGSWYHFLKNSTQRPSLGG